jgi:hypothetical protein
MQSLVVHTDVPAERMAGYADGTTQIRAERMEVDHVHAFVMPAPGGSALETREPGFS